MMGTNIDTVVVAYDDIKYINWAIMKEVTSDGSFFASLIQGLASNARQLEKISELA